MNQGLKTGLPGAPDTKVWQEIEIERSIINRLENSAMKSVFSRIGGGLIVGSALAVGATGLISCGGSLCDACNNPNFGKFPTPTVSPMSLTFSNQALGTTSSPQTVTIGDQGSGVLTIQSITISGDFGQTNNCGSKVQTQQSCTISITFSPTMVGSRTGALDISFESITGPFVVSLMGTGVSALAVSQVATCDDRLDSRDPCTAPNSNSWRRLYITNFSSNSISIVDPENWRVESVIPVGKNPAGLVLLPDGKQLYVSNAGEDTLSVIDTERRAVVATVSVGAIPMGIAASPDGATVWVADFGGNTVSVVDTRMQQVRATIPVGPNPRGVVLSAEGTRAYVTNLSGGSVSEIDVATNTVVATIRVGHLPTSSAVTPNGEFLYVCNAGSNSISVVATSRHIVAATVPVGVNPVAVAMTRDGTRAFVVNENSLRGPGTVSVVDTARMEEVATLTVGISPVAIENDMHDGVLYVSNYLDGTISLVDLSALLVQSTHASGLSALAIAAAPGPPIPSTHAPTFPRTMKFLPVQQ